MKKTTVLNFNSNIKNTKPAFGLRQTINEVLELKLEALTARAILAASQLSDTQAEEMEKSAIENYLKSQKTSSAKIDQAFMTIGNKNFQSIAVGIASLRNKNNFDEADELFEETVNCFAGQIFNLVNLPQPVASRRMALAA